MKKIALTFLGIILPLHAGIYNKYDPGAYVAAVIKPWEQTGTREARFSKYDYAENPQVSIGFQFMLPAATKKLFYFSGGLTIMPSLFNPEDSVSKSTWVEKSLWENVDREHYYYSYDGYIGTTFGVHVALSPAFRPGLIWGWGIRRESESYDVIRELSDTICEGTRYTTYRAKLKAHIGLTIQSGIMYIGITNNEGFIVGFCSGIKNRMKAHEERLRGKK